MYFVTDTSSFLLLSSLLTQTIPYGVLCFLPSYKMLEKLSNRWQVYIMLFHNNTEIQTTDKAFCRVAISHGQMVSYSVSRCH